MSVDHPIVRCVSQTRQWLTLILRVHSGERGGSGRAGTGAHASVCLRWEPLDRKDPMIRRATPKDAEALSALSRECFTQTFGHL